MKQKTPRLFLWRQFVIAMVRTFGYWRLLILFRRCCAKVTLRMLEAATFVLMLARTTGGGLLISPKWVRKMVRRLIEGSASRLSF
jgi:hypothetical protein